METKLSVLNSEKKYSFFDIHSHYNLFEDTLLRDESIEKLKDMGAGTITIGTGYETSLLAIELAKIHSHIYASIGLHPVYTEEEVWDTQKYKSFYESQPQSIKDKIVCIGECGFDYFHKDTPRMRLMQKDAFISQVELALTLALPLQLHLRPSKKSMDAYEDGLDILESYAKTYGDRLRGDAHFFGGSRDIAKRFLDIGFTMSFDGPITFSKDYDEVIKYIPIDMLMCETDSPYAAPAPYRGQSTHPWMVEEVYKKVAELKEVSVLELQIQCRKTVQRVFGIY
jgi:TatD DNase family protein